MRDVDWSGYRKKAWHAALVLGAAYATVDPRFAWAVPALTAIAGQSSPPVSSELPRTITPVLLALGALGFAQQAFGS